MVVLQQAHPMLRARVLRGDPSKAPTSWPRRAKFEPLSLFGSRAEAKRKEDAREKRKLLTFAVTIGVVLVTSIVQMIQLTEMRKELTEMRKELTGLLTETRWELTGHITETRRELTEAVRRLEMKLDLASEEFCKYKAEQAVLREKVENLEESILNKKLR